MNPENRFREEPAGEGTLRTKQRKPFFILAAELCFSLTVSAGQDIVENSRNPANPAAGRILPLKIDLKIEDAGGKFYFKLPWSLETAPDGSIFVQDGTNLFKFDAAGKFIKNFSRIGQGPGEISTELTDVLITDQDVIVLCGPMNKIVKTDLTGRYIKDIIPEGRRILNLLGFYGGRYMATDLRPPAFDNQEGPLDFIFRAFIFGDDGKASDAGIEIGTRKLIRIYNFSGRTGRSLTNITSVQTSRRTERYLYIAHTSNYLIKQFDLEEMRIRKTFRRDFPRIKNIKPVKGVPFPDYENDIHRLIFVEGGVWVLTSSVHPDKGILTDAFDAEGNFVDSFYLPLKGLKTGDDFSQRYFPITYRDGRLYTVEHDADWNFHIARYIIGEKPFSRAGRTIS
jgi:hypothetical protein